MVSSGIFYTGIGFLVVVFIGLVIYVLTLIFKEEDKPDDDPIVLNLMSEKTHGHAYGSEKAAQRTSSGRMHCTFVPKDVRPKAIMEKTWQEQEIIVDFDKVLTFPKGTVSKHKTLKVYLPQRAEDLSPAVRETSLGKVFMVMIETKNFEKSLTDMLREGTKRRDDVLKELGDGELSAEWLESIKALLTEDIKATIMKAGKDTHSFGTHGSNPGAS